jgi:hypothetical protein
VHRIAFAVSLLAGLFATTPVIAAEPLVVDLWPGKTPGEVGINARETSRIHQSPIVGPTKLNDKDEIRRHLRIPADTPPIFLAHATDDNESYGGSSAESSAIMYLALKRASIPAELHIYATGDHDLGVRQNEKLPSSWSWLCVKWLRSQGLLKTRCTGQKL